jgi:threonylcarbamoyladenosine tRNA methylthiotransferase MtaB
MRTYALATLGCKVNQYESESIRRQLTGYRQVGFDESADLYIINSCGVTAEAESKARQLIRRARKTGPGARLVFTGCYRPEETERLRHLGVDVFVAAADKERLAELLDGVGGPKNKNAAAVIKPTRTRAFIKVQDGCDQRCSYCAIPDFRGRPRSRDMDEVVAEIRTLAEKGVPEVVLTGIHLGKYGVDINLDLNLSVLVAKILKETRLPRLRLSSIEPPEITGPLIALMAREDRLANHLHLPLQSGSDEILRAMNRPYTVKDVLGVISRAREAVPLLGVTTDIMVGFPGESDLDFAATLKVVAEARFSRLHVFKFSPRPGTPAADMSGQVPARIKSERAAIVRSAGRAEAERFAGLFPDRIVSVLTEPVKEGEQTGLTGEYVWVKFNQPIGGAGRIVSARIEKTEGELLVGSAHDK